MKIRCDLILLFLFPLLIVGTTTAFAQTPNNQDCFDAIPICQNVYSTNISYSGDGNIHNEINNNSSCLGSGELNDVWYTFTVQQSGNLNFTITPNNSSDDYDWAVYNLTNNNCSQIFSNPGLEVSCNFSATPGTTGPNGGSGFSSQNAAGTPDNAVIPVLVGQTYVVNVSNYSSTQYGYTINFGASSAVIFDQIPPTMVSVSNPGCGGNTLTVTFSENILCNTVQPSDFSFSGPGGPYTVTNVTSPVCASGGNYDIQYTFTISPAITNAGTYYANLVGPVTDLCGNVAIYPAQIPFTVGSFTFTNATTPASCAGNNGTAAITTVGAGPFTYSWNPNVSATNSANNLAGGNYVVTITDQSTGCISLDTIAVGTNNTLSTTTSGDDTICPGASTFLSVNVFGGTNPITYTWSNALPNSASVSVSPATTTTYTLNIVDANGCTAGPLLFTVTVAGPVSITASGASPICVGTGTTLTSNASSGFGAFTYTWMPGNLSGSSVNVTPATSTIYTVTATDGCGQSATQTVNVIVQQMPVISFTADTTYGCSPLLVHFTVDTSGFGNASFLWSFSDNNSTSTQVNPQHSFTTAGCHDVSLTVTLPPGCSVTTTYPCMIKTYAQPTAIFTATPTFTDIMHPTIDFTNSSTGSTIWNWNYGDTTTSNVFDESHTYGFPGVYPVQLIVLNDSGCSDTAYVIVTVNDYHTFYVPNAFTPDGNGRNEFFIPEYTNILSEGYDMMIFDRWGNLVFESKNPKDGWDGTWRSNGTPAELGVYVYRINYTDNMFQKYQLIGHVTLIR